MLRQNQPVAGERQEAQADKAAEALARRQNGARRTAWIIAAIAIAFFVASLVQGHLARIPH